jgi:hypothetical protein
VDEKQGVREKEERKRNLSNNLEANRHRTK